MPSYCEHRLSIPFSTVCNKQQTAYHNSTTTLHFEPLLESNGERFLCHVTWPASGCTSACHTSIKQLAFQSSKLLYSVNAEVNDQASSAAFGLTSPVRITHPTLDHNNSCATSYFLNCDCASMKHSRTTCEEKHQKCILPTLSYNQTP